MYLSDSRRKPIFFFFYFNEFSVGRLSVISNLVLRLSSAIVEKTLGRGCRYSDNLPRPQGSLFGFATWPWSTALPVTDEIQRRLDTRQCYNCFTTCSRSGQYFPCSWRREKGPFQNRYHSMEKEMHILSHFPFYSSDRILFVHVVWIQFLLKKMKIFTL